MENFIDIINSIAYEKGLEFSKVENILIDSLIDTAKRQISSNLVFDAFVDKDTKQLKLIQNVVVVDDDDEKLQLTEEDAQVDPTDPTLNKENYMGYTEALKVDSKLDVGDTITYDLEFETMGRNTSTSLFLNLEYRLQREVEQKLFTKYNDQMGKIITSVVTNIDKDENTFVEIGEIRAVLYKKNRIKGETFKVGDTLRAVIRSVKVDKRHGLIIELSRTSPKFLEALLILEVPELQDKKIIIHQIARIPGVRAKIAVSSVDHRVEAIGTIVGLKGVRINAVSEQLNNENIDCIEYSEIPEIFVSRALSPAIINSVSIKAAISTDYNTDYNHKDTKPTATAVIFNDQKARVIGKSGLNIRLASMLTKHNIEFNEIEGNASADGEQTAPKTKDTSNLDALFS